jgi:putative aldouronate transport system permease protein
MKAKNASKRKIKLSDLLFHFINYTLNIFLVILCTYPFYYIFLVSISDSNAVSRGEVVLWPLNTSFYYYEQVFALEGILNSLLISVSRSVIGTLITLFFTTMIAYVLTKKQFKWRKVFYRLIIFTMYVNVGIIPYVLTMTALGLKNNYLLYILPSAVYPFGMILIKTYIEQLPQDVEESAIVDGAGYFTVLLRIIVPISKPVIAAVAVFCAVGQWNSFQDNFFLVQDKNLTTMQLLLWNFLQQAESLARRAMSLDSLELARMTPPSPFTFKCAISVLAMIPVMVVYPLLQKHFVQGIMMGAVKG